MYSPCNQTRNSTTITIVYTLFLWCQIHWNLDWKQSAKHWMSYICLWCVNQGFEIRTGPYGPTGKTVNHSQSRFFMLKNRSMSKKQGTVRIAVQPHGFENRNQTASHGSLWIWTFQKKKKKHRKTKEKETQLQRNTETQLPLQRNTERKLPLKRKKKSTSCLPLLSPEKHNMYLCFFFFSLQGTSRSSLSSETLLLGEASFKF